MTQQWYTAVIWSESLAQPKVKEAVVIFEAPGPAEALAKASDCGTELGVRFVEKPIGIRGLYALLNQFPQDGSELFWYEQHDHASSSWDLLMRGESISDSSYSQSGWYLGTLALAEEIRGGGEIYGLFWMETYLLKAAAPQKLWLSCCQ